MFLWHENPFETRQNLVDAHNELFDPLLPTFSPGGARVQISAAGSSCLSAAAEYEGYLRPLWGITALASQNDHFDHWELYRKGLVNGCNPKHDEFWGYPPDFDQILVDTAAIAYALCLCTDKFWDPLSKSDKQIVIRYLEEVSSKEFCHNNWKFFQVLIDIALEKIRGKSNSEKTSRYLDDLESLYLAEGWYGDGKNHRIDNYNAFAFHYYGLIYYRLRRDTDSERCQRFLQRAHEFAQTFVHWFADDGAILPYGRSLNYRFAAVGFWGIYASVLDPEQKPLISWGVMKKIYLDHFKWWSKQPLLHHGSKLLTLGYSYPNQFMTERYNSPQSPYWSTKAFSGLLIPASHPFWTAEAEEINLPSYYSETTGMHFSHQKGSTVALINGPWNDEYQTEKYTKFAYSSRYGFGVVTNHRTFELAHLDNMIGFSFDGRAFFVRESYEAYFGQGKMVSKWSPVDGIEVETLILPGESSHVRVHRISNKTSKKVVTKEGGFAVGMDGTESRSTESFAAKVETSTDVSTITDLSRARQPKVCRPEPNANIYFGRVLLPELWGEVPAGSTVEFKTIVAAGSREAAKIWTSADQLDLSWPEETVRVPCNK